MTRWSAALLAVVLPDPGAYQVRLPDGTVLAPALFETMIALGLDPAGAVMQSPAGCAVRLREGLLGFRGPWDWIALHALEGGGTEPDWQTGPIGPGQMRDGTLTDCADDLRRHCLTVAAGRRTRGRCDTRRDEPHDPDACLCPRAGQLARPVVWEPPLFRLRPDGRLPGTLDVLEPGG